MKIDFEKHHFAMLLKYSGISFISGAVNHGFFSGERSLWTAAMGVLLFLVGAVMAHQLEDSSEAERTELWRTLLLGAMLSVGLGFFTGGLQHFPDSPARSAWVVPLGFVISIPALAWSTSYDWKTSSTVYVLLAGVLITAGSFGTWQWLERNSQYLGSHAHGPEGHSQAESDATVALKVDRTIDIHMTDEMRFVPDSIEIRAGETVRLQVFNDGKLQHELVLGTKEEISEHAEQMKKMDANAHEAHAHMSGTSIELGPGERGDLVLRFSEAKTLWMACLVPGHYQAGMKGKLEVKTEKEVMPSAPKNSPPAHDHSKHKH